jgi:long-chain acyl-CoA synthetase
MVCDGEGRGQARALDSEKIDEARRAMIARSVDAEITRINEDLASDEALVGAQIKRFLILNKELDPDDGEITRTRKLRRKVVEERYAPIIDAIYDGKGSVVMKAQITYETGETGSIERELLVQEV